MQLPMPIVQLLLILPVKKNKELRGSSLALINA